MRTRLRHRHTGLQRATIGVIFGATIFMTACKFSAENDNVEKGNAVGGVVAGGLSADMKYGIGIPASDSVIAAMNYDIGSDGLELPAGSGTPAEGAVLYAAQCAMCHGVKGEGMAPAFPQLLGRVPATDSFNFANDASLPHTIGNYWPHATTLFDYTKRAMPFLTPGSLTDSQVYALVAFMLSKEQIIADTATMNAETLRRVRMPFQDRFVPDNRRPTAPK
jgi:cytochrome c